MKTLLALLSFFTAEEREDRGATMVEYALLVSLIAIVAIVGVTLFGSALSGFFSDLAGQI